MEAEKRPRIGIMGGTFDPIHYGHLVTAAAAQYEYGLDEVVFVPSGTPPHKKGCPVSEPGRRYMMCVLATITNKNFRVSDIEIEREGYSYTKDTVRAFQEKYKGNCDIFFISGADAVLDILNWKDVEDLMSNCSFIAATRPGFDLDEAYKLPPNFVSKINFIKIPALAISSTDIRNRVATGRPISYLLPETVEIYIHKNGLYLNKG